MMIVKAKKTIPEKIEEVREMLMETDNVPMMNYYRGVIEGLEYAYNLQLSRVEMEEAIEV